MPLARLFCCKYTRKVASDNTLRFAGQGLQLLPGPERLSYARLLVEIHQRLDGSRAVFHHGQVLLHLPAPDNPPPLRTAARGTLAPTPQLQPLPAPPTPARAANRSPRKPALGHAWKQSHQTMRPPQRTLPWIA